MYLIKMFFQTFHYFLNIVTFQIPVENLSNVHVWCSHPIRELNEEDTLWNLGTGYENGEFYYSVLKFNSSATFGQEIARLPCRKKDSPAYMHSFGMY